MLMAQIQLADGNAETMPSYDAKTASKVNASSKVHEQVSHVKCKTIIKTFDDDQIDSNIIFDDPYVENNGSTSEHNSNAHNEYREIQVLAYNVKKEAKNKKRLNNELKKQKMLLQKELETCKDRDPFPKDGLGYKNLEHLKKAIAAQPKMYDGENLHSTKLIIDLPDSKETLEDAEESRLKMRNKMNQDPLIAISKLKNKLQTVDKGKNVNTKFDKSETSGTLLFVTPLPKNIAVKAKKVSNSKVNADRSTLVTSHPTPKNEQGQKQNENVLARGMSTITKTETHTPDSKTNINVSNFTSVESSNSVRRPKSKDTKSKNRVLKNTNAHSLTAHVRKMSHSASIDSNKRETKNSNVIQLILWIVDGGCSKHMTGNLQLLRNFVEKFMITVCFWNDHFIAITGYGDYIQVNLTICHVYYVEGLDSSEDSQSVPSKTDLDNLFGPLYEEYYETSSPEVLDNSAANTLDNDNTSLSSSIVVEEDEAPQIVSSSAEQVATKPNSSVLNENAVSTIEPKNIKEALLDVGWIESMQDELNQFKRLDV
uniref:Gag-Pol polyprotein n=1 Tax=Tanacetum cinerariifolium TaxID=118510 RepID=A0A6L2JSG9_TANCI|nr:Gag-Pol polyprotein [Tanacetum cinerariifolium]